MPESNLSGLLILISGPAGAGKSSVCNKLATELPATFAVSCTTRASKPQDALGKKYLFVTDAEFQQKLEAGDFLEYANVFGHWYGTLRRPVEESLVAGKTVLMEIDIQGAQQVHKLFPDALGIFILPDDAADQLKRLQDRGRDDEATIQRRLAGAQKEIQFARDSGIYDLLVVNRYGALEETIQTIKQTIAQKLGARS
ncbi:MAG: guanylate kinase [Phycisphaerae bacterium]